MILAGVLKDSESDVAALDGATQARLDVTQEKGDRAEPLAFRDISLKLVEDDKDEGDVSTVLPTDIAVKGNELQVPRSPQPRRSGSEVSEKSPVPSLPIRAQVTRASSSVSASTEAFSLLLVDDNVSK